MYSMKSLFTLCIFLFGFSILMLSPQTYAAVSQIHLSWQHDPASSMTIMWSSNTSHKPPKVEYGETTAYGNVATGVDTEHGEYIHTVELTGLTPDTLYHYHVSDDGGLWSQDYTFWTAPAPGTSGTNGLVFTAVADKNSTPNSILINSALAAQNADLHIIAGDLAYTASDSNYHTWIEQQSVYAASAAVMPAWGNHDIDKPPYSFAQAHFAMPTNGTSTERYYSYDVGNAHFLAIDSNTDNSTDPGSAQHTFIDNDLASAASNPNIQWIIAYFHRNVYSGGGGHSDYTKLRTNLQPLFDKYNVDLVFHAHNHNYVRTKPLAYDSIIKDDSDNFGPEVYDFSDAGHGQIYLVVGGGGAELHPCSTTLPNWVIRCDSEFSFARVTINTNTLTFQALRSDGSILDDGFTIRKSPAGALAALYSFDEGSGQVATDSSGNGNHGTIVGGPIWTTGKSGGGLNFDGINDSVLVPRINNDEISLCAWFNKSTNDTALADAIFGGMRWNLNPQLQQGFDVRFNPDSPNILKFALVTQNASGDKTIKTATANLLNSIGNWYHVAGTYNKIKGEQKLYVNGMLVTMQTHPAGNTIVPMTAYPDMRVGYSRVNKGYFSGIIDDVRLYKRALSDKEIRDLYNAFTTGIQIHYTLDEGAGTIAHDTSGNGNHGKIQGAVWAAGKSDNGLSFDGVDDSVSVPRMNNNEISLSAWFRKNTNDTNHSDAIFSGLRWNSDPQRREGFEVRFNSSSPDTLRFSLVTRNGTGTRTTKTVKENLINSVNTWYHVVCTYNVATGKQHLYVNGQLVDTDTHPAGNTIVPLIYYTDMKIGYSRYKKGYFNGLIDDIRLYKRALTSQEIQDLYNSY
ncbi:MAG: fibronectin type III domain-containing protein [Candidatus Jettenia sp.]|nr:MAG: fibronectin type III domain-containing protein [Candidatus Jettenia sp.]